VLRVVIAVALGLAQPAAGSIRGFVVDARDGGAVGRVSIRLQDTGATVVTGDDGRFELTGVAPGDHELYVSAVDFGLVKRTVTVVAGAAADVTIVLGSGAFTDTVTVRGQAPERREPESAAEQRLGGSELQQLRGLLTNDPLRAVQALPGVATGDDFRSEFAVRGLGVDMMNFTFEGVSTPLLVHTVREIRETGSVAMINADVLADATLNAGTYPQRYGNRLGAELDFRMREGSRERVQSHVSVSATDAAVVAEGPIGELKNGSWLASVRKSYLDFVIEKLYPDQQLGFSFADAQGKLVYDVTPHQQIQFAITAGESTLKRRPDLLLPGDLSTGTNQSAVGVFSWRYLPSSTLTLTSRTAVTANAFENISIAGPELDNGHSHDLIDRVDAVYSPSTRLTIETGGEVRQSAGSLGDSRLGVAAFVVRDRFDGTAWQLSGYALARATLAGGATIVPGVRFDRWTLTDHAEASPWIEASAPIASSLTLRGGAGVSRQDPGFDEVVGLRGTADLATARAYQVEAGIEGRITRTARWQVTAYDREDRDLLRLPNAEVRLFGDFAAGPSTRSRYVNAIDGFSRGVELLVERKTANGLSGWLSYSLGFARDRDRTTGESFWSDFDQRHTINFYGNYRLTERSSIGARFRAGSNFPAPGYWQSDAGGFALSDQRNTLRIPPYARLDVRGNRTFAWQRKRLTLFVEVLNVLDRTNERVSIPLIDPRTLRVTNLFETLVPLVPSAGLLLEF
jgi:hypothetical protein